MRRKFWLIPFLLGLYLTASPLVSAQSDIQVIEQSIESRFRVAITAELSAQHDREITNVEFFYRISGRLATVRKIADFEPGQIVDARFRINQRANYMPPGTEIEYWWRLTDAEGNTFKTEPASYLYLDNRFDFKNLSNERLTLYWYNGNRAFGQALFQQAIRGLDRLERDVGVALEKPIKVFIYGSHDDLLDAISLGAHEWTGGVAYSDHGVVVIGIEPDNLEWGLRAMTHEMTHLVINQAVDNPYGDLPTWLNEGIAVYNEDPDALAEKYIEVMAEATANNSLYTLQTLSSSFPADSEGARLAYGQSGSVVQFMVNTYGPEAMASLFEIFAEGTLIDTALTEALGEDTRSLDNAFRTSLGLPTLPDLSQAQTEPLSIETEAAGSEPANSESSPAGTEPVPEKRDQAAGPPPPSEETTPQKNNRGLQCLGGLLSLAALGLIVTHRRGGLFWGMR